MKENIAKLDSIKLDHEWEFSVFFYSTFFINLKMLLKNSLQNV